MGFFWGRRHDCSRDRDGMCLFGVDMDLGFVVVFGVFNGRVIVGVLEFIL